MRFFLELTKLQGVPVSITIWKRGEVHRYDKVIATIRLPFMHAIAMRRLEAFRRSKAKDALRRDGL